MDLYLMIDGQEGVTWPEWVALAETCEAHGIPGLFRSDHYLHIGHADRGSLDAWATIAALAAVTTKLRLGTLVSPVTLRHPSTLAKMVTTVDHVSGGRVEVALGAGWHAPEHQAYGFSFPPIARRMDLLEEQLQVMLGHWGESPFSFQGHYYKLRDLDAQPKPLQQPHPRLILGGAARPRSVALAARFADEYNSELPALEAARQYRSRIAEACKRIGRAPIPFSVSTTVAIGATAREARDRIAEVNRISGEDALLPTPRSTWLAGTLDEATDQLLILRDAGVHRVFCQHLAHRDLGTVALLSELAKRVA